MIDYQVVLNELRSLEKQKAETLATLHQIEGAERMCRHLLAKGAPAPVQEEASPAAELNGALSRN